jgi:hypothetical protein
MADLKTILCINHRDTQCGVHQFFKRLTAPLIASKKYNVYYIDPAEESEFHYWCEQLKPDIILYNFYTSATMPWLTPEKIASWRTRFKQTCLFHEVPIAHMGFDLVFHQDPDDTMTPYYKLARPIPIYTPDVYTTYISNPYPVIGSFGFGLGGKGFGRIAALASQQFEKAHLRFNIPYAHFGDIDGRGAHDWARHIIGCVTNENITVEISHDFMDEPQLLHWLAQNDMNAFLYDENYGRGISGTLDYALAVRRPIAITKSWQFKHIWNIDNSFLVENNTLDSILQRGVGHLEKFHTLWGDTPVRESFERGFDTLV